MKIYIDGAFDSNRTGPTGVRTNPPSLRIGSIQTGTGFLSGILSDVTLYEQTLTSNQIATLYSAATGFFYSVTLTNKVSGANLVLSWPGNGRLLEATNLAGPWTTNASVSPVTVAPNQPQKFTASARNRRDVGKLKLLSSKANEAAHDPELHRPAWSDEVQPYYVINAKSTGCLSIVPKPKSAPADITGITVEKISRAPGDFAVSHAGERMRMRCERGREFRPTADFQITHDGNDHGADKQ